MKRKGLGIRAKVFLEIGAIIAVCLVGISFANSRLIESVKESGKVAEFSRDDLIINQKRLINIAKELSFVLGTRSDEKYAKNSETVLRANYESIFGEGSSKGKSVSRLAGEVIAKLESQNYSGLELGSID